MLIFGVRALSARFKVNSVVDQQVRKTLVDTLYSNPLSLVIGAVCGTVVCIYAAITTGDFALELAAWGVGLIGLIRTAIMMAVRHTKGAKTRTLELLFEVGAFAYAGALSILAAFAVVHKVIYEVQMLAVVVAVSYATAIAARNAGRPFIAIGQLLLVLAPLSVALFSAASRRCGFWALPPCSTFRR